MANYATQSEVEGILGRSLTSQEQSGLTFLLNAIDQWINDQIGASFTIPDEAATRYYDPDFGGSIIDIDPLYTGGEDNTPVVAVVDSDENVVSTLDESIYELRPRNEDVKTWIQLRGGRKWASVCSTAVTNIAVTGKFGRGSDVPADIKYLAAYLAAQSIGATNSLSLKSESIEGYSRTFATTSSDYSSDAVVKRTLDKYREVLI